MAFAGSVFGFYRHDALRAKGEREVGNADFKRYQVGFTLGGYIDYARDRMDISGTFVPAYGLNNAFAQVPLFGAENTRIVVSRTKISRVLTADTGEVK